MDYCKKEVLSNGIVAEGIYKLVLEGDYNCIPGQFYMIRAWKDEPILSRPISVEDVGEGSISFVYQVIGRGTEIMSGLKKGDYVDILGPSGNGFNIEGLKGRVGIVTGGIGIAPMVYTAKSLKNCETDIYCGFRNKSYLLNELSPYVNITYISTESGEEGQKGYVTDIFLPEKYDVVLCCGPEIMMNKIIKMCMEKNVPVYVSMEKHMACGVGACLVCTCKTTQGNKRTCKDGPVFLGSDVIIDA